MSVIHVTGSRVFHPTHMDVGSSGTHSRATHRTCTIYNEACRSGSPCPRGGRLRASGWHASFGTWTAVSRRQEEIGPREGDDALLSWALTFLVLALIAGALGFSGIAGASANIAWLLFVVFLALTVVAAVSRAVRGTPPV